MEARPPTCPRPSRRSCAPSAGRAAARRAAAAELHLSRFTVDAHLRHVYGRLGVNSAGQAVAALAGFGRGE